MISTGRRLKLTIGLFVSSVVVCGYTIYRANDAWLNPQRYRTAFARLESASPSERSSALREILNPTDFPLPGVERQTRLAVDMMFGDEEPSVRSRACMSLSAVAGRLHDSSPSDYQRIIVAISRAMADDPDPVCRRMAAFSMEFHVTGRPYIDAATAKLCESYWRRAARDTDKDVAELAVSFVAALPNPSLIVK